VVVSGTATGMYWPRLLAAPAPRPGSPSTNFPHAAGDDGVREVKHLRPEGVGAGLGEGGKVAAAKGDGAALQRPHGRGIVDQVAPRADIEGYSPSVEGEQIAGLHGQVGHAEGGDFARRAW
jgi:hypothetical protein